MIWRLPILCRFIVQVLARLNENLVRARQREASEKRQGTKSRQGVASRAAAYGELAF